MILLIGRTLKSQIHKIRERTVVTKAVEMGQIGGYWSKAIKTPHRFEEILIKERGETFLLLFLQPEVWI